MGKIWDLFHFLIGRILVLKSREKERKKREKERERQRGICERYIVVFK